MQKTPEAGDQLEVLVPIRTHDMTRALVVPGDRVWVVEVRGEGMRVRCPEAHYDAWLLTNDPRLHHATR